MQLKSLTVAKGEESAFTLLELMVVVTILTLLALLLFPSFKFLIEKTQGAACAGNMKALAAALFSYQADHNGWFPPGYPVSSSSISAANQQPGMPSQPGLSELHFKPYLVPSYLKEMPVCPGNNMTAAAKKISPNWRKRLSDMGGGYAINAFYVQWKPVAFPPRTWTWNSTSPYIASQTVFLTENLGYANATWSTEHLDQALDAQSLVGITGRSHGSGGALNFMFYDGHIEVIARNAPEGTPPAKLQSGQMWMRSNNPRGKFSSTGSNDTIRTVGYFDQNEFKKYYPQFFPPDNP